MEVLTDRLASFARSVRAARAPTFDWRAAYRRIGAEIPDDMGLLKLFNLTSADIEQSVLSGAMHAYHNHLHTLDTMLAVDALCAAATRIGFSLPVSPHLLKIVMLGHDLRHPGGFGAPAQDLEQRSASFMSEFAGTCGVPSDVTERIADLILATRPAHQIAIRTAGGGDVLHMIVGEADVMASLLPGLGLELAADLTREMQEVGDPLEQGFEAPARRQAFLSTYLNVSAPAEHLGLGAVVREQIARFR